ncbi:MAG: V-type ATP synthase subunit B, partial [Anaerolineae bacterium]|nr:V-type ATP synthase subunit B [Anaerolineae bacterium]
GFTRSDHPHVASQLYAAYAGAQNARSLASVIGEEELSAVDQAYLRFGDGFERRFLLQGRHDVRSIEQTLDIGWDVLSVLPRSELTRVREEEIDAHYDRQKGEGERELSRTSTRRERRR